MRTVRRPRARPPIRRDRNHPSVILWSVFNEEPSQGTERGYELVRRVSASVKELDTTGPSRPGEGERAISILIEVAAEGTPGGLGGTVTVE